VAQVEIELSLREALLGFDRPIKHLDGKEVWVHSRRGEVINFNDVLVLPGQGMPGNREEYGSRDPQKCDPPYPYPCVPLHRCTVTPLPLFHSPQSLREPS